MSFARYLPINLPDNQLAMLLDLMRPVKTAAVAAALLLPACSSVPGESMAPFGVQREVRERVLTLARSAEPPCREPKISTTELVEVHPDGRPAAEVWTVEQCGRRVNYVVSFPARKGAAFSVRAER